MLAGFCDGSRRLVEVQKFEKVFLEGLQVQARRGLGIRVPIGSTGIESN